MPLLIIGIIAVFIFFVIKQLSVPASKSRDTDRLHPEQFSAELRNSRQLKCADVSRFTDRIDLDRIKLDFSVLPQKFVVFDLETTGLDTVRDEIIEIGAIRVDLRQYHSSKQFSNLVTSFRTFPW